MLTIHNPQKGEHGRGKFFAKGLRATLFSSFSRLLRNFFSRSKTRKLSKALSKVFSKTLSKTFLQKSFPSFVRPCMYTLSFTLIFAPALTLSMPQVAVAHTADGPHDVGTNTNDKYYIVTPDKQAPVSTVGQSSTYDYAFKIEDSSITDHNIFGGSVGNETRYSQQVYTDYTLAKNNTLHVRGNASIDPNNNIDTFVAYTISASGAHMALFGKGLNATAEGNQVFLSNEGGNPYVANLHGAYIGINSRDFLQALKQDREDFGLPASTGVTDVYLYTPTTVNTLTMSNNSVIMTGGTVGLGYADFIGASGTSTEGHSLAGAHVNSFNSNADAQFFLNNNSVLIAGGTVDSIGSNVKYGALTGAYVNTPTGTGILKGNHVTISGGDVQAISIMGATFYGKDIPLFGNTNDSDKINRFGFTQNKSHAFMSGNSVTITGADKDFNVRQITGAHSRATSSSKLFNNSVNISGGTFNAYNTDPLYLSGAYIYPENTQKEANATATGYITPDGTTVNMEASENSVNITGGTIKGSVVGAIMNVANPSFTSVEREIIYNGTISNNTVNIYGGTINGESALTSGIYGGVYQGKDSVDSTDSTKRVSHTYSITNNTVNIGFSAMLGNQINIGGGAFNEDSKIMPYDFNLTPNANAYDGNTLNLYHLATNKQSVGTVANFENINIVLGAENTSNQLATVALIELSDTLYLGNGYATQTDATANKGTLATKYAKFGLHTSLDNTLKNGDKITLLKATKDIDGNFSNLGANNSGIYTGVHGALLGQTWDIQTNTGTMTATLLSTQAGEQAKVVGEASLASMTALSNSTDILLSQTMPSALKNVKEKQAQNAQSGSEQSSASAGFMVSSAGTSRYKTGSHVDVNGISMTAGLAYGDRAMSGDWLAGGFLEYNYGSYSTFNAFSTGNMHGGGNINAVGVGGFGRYEFDHANYMPYVEGSLRLGYMELDYASSDLINYSAKAFNQTVSYDVEHMYISAHLGVGNEYHINDKLSLDASFKYLWTLQTGGTKELAGHQVKYEAVNSHRARLEARANYLLRDDEVEGKVDLYGGLGLEYEFDGKARNSVDGYAVAVPDLTGLTVLGDFGIRLKPIAKTPLTFDLGVQTFAGQREGIRGSMQVMYEF